VLTGGINKNGEVVRTRKEVVILLKEVIRNTIGSCGAKFEPETSRITNQPRRPVKKIIRNFINPLCGG
jgi:hypothetical protein